MTQPTPTAAPPALLNITLGVMLALMLGWFFHIASGVLVPMVLGLMISYVVMAVLQGLVPALDLALRLGMIGRAANVFHAFAVEPGSEVGRDV